MQNETYDSAWIQTATEVALTVLSLWRPQMDHKVCWKADLKAPSEPCRREHEGVPLFVSDEDIGRAAAEFRKGLHEVVFNTVLITPRDGQVHYILGSLA